MNCFNENKKCKDKSELDRVEDKDVANLTLAKPVLGSLSRTLSFTKICASNNPIDAHASRVARNI